MSVRQRQARQVLGSSAVMLVVWAVSTLGAFGPALAGAGSLSRRIFIGPGGRLHLEATAGSSGMVATVIAAAAILGGTLLLSPVLNIAWLHALASPGRLATAVERGVRCYPAALLVTLALTPALALALALGAGLPWATAHALSDAAAPTREVAILFAAVPGLAALAIWATWHELARARIAGSGDGPLGAVLAVRRALRPGSVARYVAYFAAAGLLGATGLAATTHLSTASAVAIGQIFIVARVALRGFFLAGLLPAVRH